MLEKQKGPADHFNLVSSDDAEKYIHMYVWTLCTYLHMNVEQYCVYAVCVKFKTNHKTKRNRALL